jgi:putative hydrolase of the HAD superfamily
MPRQIEAVIFDCGGVLILPPPPEQTRELAAICGLGLRNYRRRWRRERGEYDRGTLQARVYWARILAASGRGLDLDEPMLQELVRRDFASWSRTNEPALAWARRLTVAGVRTAILSNMPAELLRLARLHLPWFEEFPVSVFSCEVGLIKPEPGIFWTCLEALGTAPERTLFVDDHPGNVRAARRLGMAALRFRTADGLRRAAGRRFGLGPLTLPAADRAAEAAE